MASGLHDVQEPYSLENRPSVPVESQPPNGAVHGKPLVSETPLSLAPFIIKKARKHSRRHIALSSTTLSWIFCTSIPVSISYSRLNEEGRCVRALATEETAFTSSISAGPANLAASGTRSQTYDPTPSSPYVVIGVFSKARGIPKERLVLISNPKRLFRTLSWNEAKLLGWLKTLLSLKGVRNLRIYECVCSPEDESHNRIALSEQQIQVIAQLTNTYCAWFVPGDVNEAWTKWIQENLNLSDRKYSIELIYGWSPLWVSLFIAYPIVISLITGIWYMQATGDVATAWTIASYVVTAASVMVALFAILNSIADV